MSGVLASISSAGSGGLVSEVLGLLHPASFRGVIFEVFDATDDAGRRWQLNMFPGRGDTSQEDLGAVDGPILVNAVLIGDDYVSRYRRLKAACKAPGPAMLRHPWLGQIKVTSAANARFTWDDKALRVCKVELTFRVWQQIPPPSPSSLTSLLDRIGQAIDDAQSMLADALAPIGAVLGLVTMAASVLQSIAGYVGAALASAPTSPGAGSTSTPSGSLTATPSGSLTAKPSGSLTAKPSGSLTATPSGLSGGTPGAVPGGAAAITAAAATPLAALQGATPLVPGAAIGGQMAGLIAAVVTAIAAAGDPGDPPALGPGPLASMPATPTADPRAAAAILLAAVRMMQPAPGSPDPIALTLLVARAQTAVMAAQAASLIGWTSRDEALGWRAQVDTVLAGVQADLAAAVFATIPALRVGALWLDVRDVRAAWLADVQEIAGRLPAVQRIVTLAPMSAWAIAQAVAGDNPAGVRPAMLDLVARNGIRHPGRVPAGTIEILVT